MHSTSVEIRMKLKYSPWFLLLVGFISASPISKDQRETDRHLSLETKSDINCQSLAKLQDFFGEKLKLSCINKTKETINHPSKFSDSHPVGLISVFTTPASANKR